jgi:hypothetical protein
MSRGYVEIGLIRSARRGEGLPSNELLITGRATRTLVKPIADYGDATRSVSRRVASRCIALHRVGSYRGDALRYLENGDLRAPEIACARTFLQRSS